jgi:3-oxoacyl-[acyl-carrier protein] reductase
MIDLKLENKRVVVVGGTNGIGLQIVTKFLQEGSEVHCISRNQKHEIETSFNKAFNNKIFFHYCDATNLVRVNECCNIIAKRGSIDILISNVGDGRMPNNDINELDIWDKSWRINFNTGLNVTKIFSKKIKKGSILFISSIAGQEFINAPTDYSVAKSALITFAKILSHKFAPNIRVNVISPGNIFIKDGTWDLKTKNSPEFVDDLLKNHVPLNRFGNPEEVADLALYLSSYKADFITGSCINIDGGQTKSF